MDIYLKSKKKQFDAHAIYNEQNKTVMVCKGSVLSTNISGGSFRSAKAVEKLRESEDVEGNIVVNDITFKSASTAANFVTGTSTNGMIAWKTADGKTLREVLG